MMHHGLSRHIARTEGFLDQINRTNTVTKAVRIDCVEERAEFRTGGEKHMFPRYRTGGNHTPSTESEEGEAIANLFRLKEKQKRYRPSSLEM